MMNHVAGVGPIVVAEVNYMGSKQNKILSSKRELELQQAKAKKKKLVTQISISAIIVVLIVGIFIFKSISDNTDINNLKIPLTVTSIDLNALKEYKMLIVIDFGADDCDPCRAMAPVLVKLNAEMQDKAVIQFVDIWKHRNAVGKFPVRSIPTQFFFYADGTPYEPSDTIKKTIEFETYNDSTTNKHSYTAHVGGLTESQLRQILAEMGVD